MATSGKLRIVLGVLLLVAAGGLIALPFSGLLAPPPGADHQGTGALRKAAAAAADRLKASAESLRERAKIAAGLEPLRSALSDRVDVPTLVDLFATEEWWRTYRDEMIASRVIIADAVAHHGAEDLGQSDRAVVIAARKLGSAGEITAVAGRALVLAAARIDVSVRGEPVVVLARPLESRVLAEAAERGELGLLLTDGRSVLAVAGSEAHRDFLRTLPGRADARVANRELEQEAVRVDLSGTAHLWVARSLVSPAGGPQRVLFFGAAGGLALVGLLLLVLGGRSGGKTGGQGAHEGEFPDEKTLPFGTSAQRPRATAGRVTTGGARSASALPRALARPGSGTMPEPDIPNTTPEPMPAVVVGIQQGDSSRLFGRYKVIERLGVGGMSEVYTAVAHGAEGFSRTFVIKRLRSELARNKDAVSQFIDEARVQASLVHSNIVPVFDFGMMGGEYFMIEEYILGRDLARVSTRCVERTGFRLEPRLAYYFIYEALQALGYAHNKRGRDGEPLGIVHRDVSATNIMVSSAGEVKLFDFGIAKANQRQTQTQAGMVKGNANFMSPEQARGQSVDARSDLFSLGLVMYYCLTNSLLYSGDNDLDVLYRAACGPTAEDLAKIRQLPPPAGEILEKALAIDVAERYQSADEFAAALAPHASGMKAEAASLMELLFGDELRQEAA